MRKTNQEEIKDYAGNIERAGRLLTAMVGDILDYSKMDMDKLVMVQRSYKVCTVADEIYVMLKGMAEEKGLELRLHMTDKVPERLIGDPDRIRQMLAGLVSNAIKFTHEGAVVMSVDAQETKQGKMCLLMRVEDTGIGIRKEDQEKIFEAFTRVDLDKNRNIEGTGLGLAITKKLVEMCGGKITVDSEYGKGSRFCIELPQDIQNSDMVEENLTNIRKLTSKENGKKVVYAPEARVLVVDDNLINRKVASALLADMGVGVDVADSGFECLELVKSRCYDLILMDHMMPEMDGVYTLKEMKVMQGNRSRDAKVVALTANAISGARESYLKEGFDEYLSKPIDVQQLEKILRRFIPDKYFVVPMEHAKVETKAAIEDMTRLYDGVAKDYAKRLDESRQKNDWKEYVLLLREVAVLAKGAGKHKISTFCMSEEKEIRRLRGRYLFQNHTILMEMMM